MLPFLAQGAAQATEDAAALTECLEPADKHSVEEALQRYEDLRRPRANRILIGKRTDLNCAPPCLIGAGLDTGSKLAQFFEFGVCRARGHHGTGRDPEPPGHPVHPQGWIATMPMAFRAVRS